MNKWIKLSEGVFLMGQGGVTYFEAIPAYDVKNEYKTVLYMGSKRIHVKESVDDIFNLIVDKC
jgi:hypothetical protein